MIQKILTTVLVAIVFGLFPAAGIVRAERAEATGRFGMAESSKAQARFGPYATLGRANAVANYARRRGYKARIIYGGSIIYGTREYYVDVWR